MKRKLTDAGIPATIDVDNDLLSPIDQLCGVKIIHWKLSEAPFPYVFHDHNTKPKLR